ncbi:hypothetical protein ACSBR1_038788 [Camellia fascicularis]
MVEQNQAHPLAAPSTHRRSNEEFAIVKPNNLHQQKTSKCLVYILFGIALLSTATLVFALAVLRIKFPQVNLSSVAVKNLKYATAPSLASMNVTMVAENSVENKIFGGFKFEESNVVVFYEHVAVGGAKIEGGRAGVRETKRVIVGVEVRSNGLSRKNQIFNNDLNSGLVNLRDGVPNSRVDFVC